PRPVHRHDLDSGGRLGLPRLERPHLRRDLHAGGRPRPPDLRRRLGADPRGRDAGLLPELLPLPGRRRLPDRQPDRPRHLRARPRRAGAPLRADMTLGRGVGASARGSGPARRIPARTLPPLPWLLLALGAALWPATAHADTCVDRFRNSGSLSKEALNDPDCGIATGVGAAVEAGGAALTAVFIIQGALAASRLVGGAAGGLGGAGGAGGAGGGAAGAA